MKPTISMIGEEITAVRFRITSDKPWHEYQSIMALVPDSPGKRRWLAGKQDMKITDGYAEVKHGE